VQKRTVVRVGVGVAVVIAAALGLSAVTAAAGPSGHAAAAAVPAAKDRSADRAAGSGTDLGINLATGGSVTPLVNATIHGTYTCNDTAATTTVRIQVEIYQPATGATGETTVSVACQKTNTAWQATVLSLLVVRDQEIDTTATLIAGQAEAQTSGDLNTDIAFVDVNPDTSLNTDGSLTVTGSYTCTTAADSGYTTVNATQLVDGILVTGEAVIDVSCPSTSNTWTATLVPVDMGAQAATQPGLAVQPQATSTFFQTDWSTSEGGLTVDTDYEPYQALIATTTAGDPSASPTSSANTVPPSGANRVGLRNWERCDMLIL
jgi:hypothetical protein